MVSAVLLDHLPGSSAGLRLAYVFVAAIFFSILRYVVTVAQFRATKNGISKQHPPLIPHVVPVLGTVPLGLVLNPLNYVQTFTAFWQRQPVRVRSFFQDIYVVQGAGHLTSMLKQHSISSFPVHKYIMANIFLLPKAALDTHAKDNSGPSPKPHLESTVEHRNRLEFHLRNSFHEFLLGPGQASLLKRVCRTATSRISSLDVGQEWTHVPDLVRLFKHHLTAASVDALTGPMIMEQNPAFPEDLWSIEEYGIRFLLKIPIFDQKPYQSRERAIEAVYSWQTWARNNFTPESVDEDGNDPFWGCSFFRKRDVMFSDMDGFCSRAKASVELAVIWAAQINAVMSSFWIVLETFLNPEYLQLVREEVQPCVQAGPDGNPQIDSAKLARQPFLQAMLSESLRLHVHGFFARYPTRKDITVNGWDIPKDHICIASSTPAHMDPDFWCAGAASAHPVDEFWPWRFLKKDAVTGELQFSLEGTEGYLVPFGVGPHACPGRTYAKRLNLLTLALMVTLYDCDVLASNEQLKMNGKKFPAGALTPCDVVPVRMRRRQYSP
ncbi:cytochrome P450 [Stachybotrys elegans]|uniref:Cytochrome P450 n=1 Tax=Stachybotrys elegans TaxID=80388 RepID=A0A8K0SEW3_9HYPO|nr:cytochrome P450 [Stachybotrys elegans]